MAKPLSPQLATLPGRLGRIASFIDEMKGENIVVLDLREIADFADAFVIASARSTTHMQAIVNNLAERLREEGLRPINSIERPAAHGDNRWVLLDFADVVVHVFTAEARAYYGLESLWGDAEQIEWQSLAMA